MANPIGWCDRTWSPITGCSPISPACDHCYAERMSHRLAGRFGYPADEPFRVTFHPDRLDEPLHWRKPQRVFVCSMGDLFHEDVPDEWIDRVISVCVSAAYDDYGPAADWHTYLFLTKRPERARLYWESRCLYDCDHIWLGVTVEDQQRADERIPILLDTPAAKRFVSCEPLLGPVDLDPYLEPRFPCDGCGRDLGYLGNHEVLHHIDDRFPELCGRSVEIPALDHIIAGGETGPGARPTHPDWARTLRDQAQAARVPFYLKKNPGMIDGVEYKEFPNADT